jgi:hypothetical protein
MYRILTVPGQSCPGRRFRQPEDQSHSCRQVYIVEAGRRESTTRAWPEYVFWPRAMHLWQNMIWQNTHQHRQATLPSKMQKRPHVYG